MVPEPILRRLEAEFDSPPEAIRAVAELLLEGAPPEFVVLYRRDETGDLGEERVLAIAERLEFLKDLDQRRNTLLEHARGVYGLEPNTPAEAAEPAAEDAAPAEGDGPKEEDAPKDDASDVLFGTPKEFSFAPSLSFDDLGELLAHSVDQDLFDDVDHFLRPQEHRVEAQVRERGLSPLIETLLSGDLGGQSLTSLAEGYVSEENGLKSVDDVLAQVVVGLAERFGEDPKLRSTIRNELARGILEARPAHGAAPQEQEPEPQEQPTEEAPEAAETPAEEAPAAEAPAAEAPAEQAATDAAPAAEAPTEEAPSEEAPAEVVAESAETATPEPATEDPAEAPVPEAEKSEATKKQPKRKGKGRDGDRYKDLLGLEEPIRRIPANRMLALRKAEREGVLELRLKLKEGRELELFRKRFSPKTDESSTLGQFLDLVYAHSYEAYVHRVCETTVRHRSKEKADRETVRSFARSLRAQLMAPALPDSICAAMRVSGKSAWYVTLGPDGTPRRKLNPNVPQDEAGRAELAKAIAEAINEDAPKALAIPHGRRERAAARLANEVLALVDAGKKPILVPMDATASVVWATSANARRRHQNSDSGMRTTLSLARRLRDPLVELSRVEPRGLGLGQNLSDVHQGLLRRQLEHTASTCLARVGVDVNRADQGLLARLPGISQHLAKAIVQHRSQNGPFKTLRGLLDLADLDERTWRHVAGFLRIREGEQVLDATTIHPEDYDIVERIAAREHSAVADLFGAQIPRVTPEECGPDVGLKRLLDVLDALRRGTADPRGAVEPVANEGVTSFADLSSDQELRGRITNMAEFGAFVDLGIGQDGLIHLSQIPGARLRDPERVLRVGEVITVYVTQLDAKTKKIGLSMFRPRHLVEGRQPTLGERMGGQNRGRGRGRGRGRDQQSDVQTRGARAPEGRRGTTRRGPRPAQGGGGGSFGGDYRDRGSRPPKGSPRVITSESDQQQKEVRGHKGELRSLAGLKALLKSEQKPDTEE